MRSLKSGLSLVSLLAFSSAVFGAPALIAPPSGTIGNNLEAFTTVRLSEPAPAGGLTVTLAADNPQALAFAESEDQRGTATLSLHVPPQRIETPQFYIQALAGHGPVTYTVSAPGCAPVKGTITIAQSAIAIGGPSNSTQFHTTTGTPRKLTARTVMLDDAGNIVGSLPVAGGLKVKLDIASSDAKVGAALPSSVEFSGGEIERAVQFKPAGTPGTAVLTASTPEGFQAAPKNSAVTITVNLPGIGVMTDINIGKNLQVLGYVMLGDDAPAGGLDVTLSSSDPSKLIFSKEASKVGSGTITVHIDAGKGTAPYYLQSLGDTGDVHYTAVAQNYRTRDAVISLKPSGFMVVFTPFGPPDEEEYLHPMPRPSPRPFFASLSDKKPLWVSVWPVYLDPSTRRGADITAQELRGGVSVPVTLKNSDPSVAEVASSVLVNATQKSLLTQFRPLKAGETTISVDTPAGFSTPSNATSVKAVVEQ